MDYDSVLTSTAQQIRQLVAPQQPPPPTNILAPVLIGVFVGIVAGVAAVALHYRNVGGQHLFKTAVDGRRSDPVPASRHGAPDKHTHEFS
jgi:hypothetical protein